MKANAKLPRGYTEENGYIRYRFMKNGIKYSHNCNYDPRINPSKAASEIEEWKKSLDNEIRLRIPDNMKNHINLNQKLWEALEAYNEHFIINRRELHEKGTAVPISKGTQRRVKDQKNRIKKYPFGNTKLRDITIEKVDAFNRKLATEYTYDKDGIEYTYSIDACGKNYGYLKGFFEALAWPEIYLNMKKYLPQKDDPRQRKLRSKTPKENTVTQNEIFKFRLALKEKNKKGNYYVDPMVQDAILYMYEHGLRVEEVRGLQRRDTKGDNVNIRRSIERGSKFEVGPIKNKLDRDVPETEEGFIISDRRVRGCISDIDFLFHQEKLLNTMQHFPLSYKQIYDGVKKTAERAGISKNIYPYIFRHTRGYEVYNDTNHDILAAQVFLGHVKSSTTMNEYMHPDESLLYDAVSKHDDQMQNLNNLEEELRILGQIK